jgi:hypothetical protein
MKMCRGECRDREKTQRWVRLIWAVSRITISDRDNDRGITAKAFGRSYGGLPVEKPLMIGEASLRWANRKRRCCVQ